MKSPHTKNTLLQAATSQPTNQSLQESVFSLTQEKIKNKKFPSLKKNKTSFHRTVQTLTDKALNENHYIKSGCKLDTSTLRTDRRASGNIGLPQWGLTWLIQVECFYQSLCLVDSLVLRNPPLRQAEKRYQQA